MATQFALVGRCPRSRYHEGIYSCSQDWIRDGYHGGVRHCGMLHQYPFDFSGCDLFPAALEYVVGSPNKIEKLVAISQE